MLTLNNPFKNMKIETFEVCDNCGGATKLKLLGNGKDFIVPCICDCRQDSIDAYEMAATEDQRRKAERRRKLETFGNVENVPSFQDKDAQTMENVMELSKNYCEQFPKFLKSGNGLLFYGSTGQGKTWFALCIANELYKRHRIKFVSAADYVYSCNLFKDGMEAYKNCDLLILDDLGSERDSSFAQEAIFNLIDSRYLSKKPMIITSNITPKEMMSQAGDITNQRIFSRVLELCMPVHVDNDRKRVQSGRYNDMKQALGIS